MYSMVLSKIKTDCCLLSMCLFDTSIFHAESKVCLQRESRVVPASSSEAAGQLCNSHHFRMAQAIRNKVAQTKLP